MAIDTADVERERRLAAERVVTIARGVNGSCPIRARTRAGRGTKFGNGRVNTYRAVTGASLPAGQ